MLAVLRVSGAILVGAVVALALLIAVELLSAVVHPPSPDFQGTQEEIHDLVARYPDWVLAVCVPLWGLTAFVSTWVAGRLGGQVAAAVVALLLAAALLCNLSMLPYPLWFKIVQGAVILIAVACGVRWTRRRSAIVADMSAAAG